MEHRLDAGEALQDGDKRLVGLGKAGGIYFIEIAHRLVIVQGQDKIDFVLCCGHGSRFLLFPG